MEDAARLTRDGEEQDLVAAVEQAFGIVFQSVDSGRWKTIGDMFAGLLAEMGRQRFRALTNPSAIAFYHIRPLLAAGRPLREVTSSTLLGDLPAQRRRETVKRLTDVTGLAVPAAMSNVTVLAILMTGLLMPLTAWFSLGPAWGLAAIPTVAVMGWLTSRFSGRYLCPRRTVGELAREIGAHNYAALIEEGARNGEGLLWRSFIQVVAEETGLGQDQLHPAMRLDMCAGIRIAAPEPWVGRTAAA